MSTSRFRGRAISTVIRSVADVQRLPGQANVNSRFRRCILRFDVPDVPRSKQLQWERKLNRYQRRCGCTVGAITLLLGLAVGVSYLVIVVGPEFSVRFLRACVAAFVAAVAASLIGKFVTLEVTRLQFASACTRLCVEVEQEIEAHTQHEGK